MAGQLDDEAFHLMRRLMQEHTAQWQAGLPDLTKPQYAVLRVVALTPGIEQLALTRAAASSKATLAEMLSRMEKRGLVRRRVDEQDRRRRYVELTDQGMALLEKSLPVARRVDGALLARLDPSEQHELLRLLKSVVGQGEDNAGTDESR